MKFCILILILILISFSSSILSQEKNDYNIDMLLLKGKYQQIVKLVEPKVNNNDTLNASEYYKLGLAYQQLYRNEKATNMFSRASRLESNNSAYLFSFAKSLLASSNSGYAYYVFKETLEKDPQNINAKIEIGKLLLDLRKFSEAKKIFKELINFDSTNVYFFQKLAYSELKLGDKDRAIINYKNSLKNELPRGKPTRYQKANAQGESGIAPRGEVLNQKENK